MRHQDSKYKIQLESPFAFDNFFMLRMEFYLKEENGTLSFVVNGKVEIADTQNLNRMFLRNIAQEKIDILFDLSGASVADPNMGRMLVDAATTLKKNGGRFRVLLPEEYKRQLVKGTERESVPAGAK